MSLMCKMPAHRAVHILGESDSRMWRMIFAQVKAEHARLNFPDVVLVGSEEVNRGKVQDYLAVFTGLLAKKVVSATPGKYSSVWVAFTANLLRLNGRP